MCVKITPVAPVVWLLVIVKITDLWYNKSIDDFGSDR